MNHCIAESLVAINHILTSGEFAFTACIECDALNHCVQQNNCTKQAIESMCKKVKWQTNYSYEPVLFSKTKF